MTTTRTPSTSTPHLTALAYAMAVEQAAKTAARGRPDESTRLATQAVERARIVVALVVACPDCHAPASEPCRTPAGVLCRQPHAGRAADSGADMTPALAARLLRRPA